MDNNLQQKLSETLHFFAADAGEAQGSWDAQTDEYKQKLVVLAQRVDKALTTLNQTVVRIDAPIVPASFEQTMLPHMIAFMQKFIAEKVKHPKGVADLFPTEELARLLIMEFGYKKAELPTLKRETMEKLITELSSVTVVQQETKTEGTPAPTVEVKAKREPTPGQKAYYERNKKNA